MRLGIKSQNLHPHLCNNILGQSPFQLSQYYDVGGKKISKVCILDGNATKIDIILKLM